MIRKKHFDKFFKEQFEMLSKSIEKKQEIRSFNVESDLREMIAKASEALKKDFDEESKEKVYVSEKTGEAILEKETVSSPKLDEEKELE